MLLGMPSRGCLMEIHNPPLGWYYSGDGAAVRIRHPAVGRRLWAEDQEWIYPPGVRCSPRWDSGARNQGGRWLGVCPAPISQRVLWRLPSWNRMSLHPSFPGGSNSGSTSYALPRNIPRLNGTMVPRRSFKSIQPRSCQVLLRGSRGLPLDSGSRVAVIGCASGRQVWGLARLDTTPSA